MSSRVAGTIRPATGPLTGTVHVPGDKSISHRMALVAAIADGRSEIRGYSAAGDCAATLGVLEGLGVTVERAADSVSIAARGWSGLRQPSIPVSCVRSGTTMRLLTGLLAGAGVEATLTGDPQLLRRPMERVAEPLRRMGARIETTEGRPPVRISPSRLRGIDYELPVASAQVKSAMLLAGLRAPDETSVTERVPTRDHTERLLSWLDLPIALGAPIRIRPGEPRAFQAQVPGDLSSAAPLLAAAAIVPGSVVSIEGVGLNPTRTAFLALLARMGAAVLLEGEREDGPEPIGNVTVEHGGLRGVDVSAGDVPGLIDELPLVGVLGAVADGTTTVRGAGELRVKESDRIAVLATGLRAMGAKVEERIDGFSVTGPTKLAAASLDGGGDHRLAMAFAVAALAADGPVEVDGLDSIGDSFPGFLETLDSLR